MLQATEASLVKKLSKNGLAAYNKDKNAEMAASVPPGSYSNTLHMLEATDKYSSIK